VRHRVPSHFNWSLLLALLLLLTSRVRVWTGIRLLGLGSIVQVRGVESTTFFCMAPGSSVHSACVHVPHSSPDTVRARDTDRDIGNICASGVQCNATLQSGMTICFGFHRKKTAGWAIVPLIFMQFRVYCPTALSIEEDAGTLPARLSPTRLHGPITEANRSYSLKVRGLFVVLPRVFPGEFLGGHL